PLHDLPTDAPRTPGDDRHPLRLAHVKPPLTLFSFVDGSSVARQEHQIKRIILMDSISWIDSTRRIRPGSSGGAAKGYPDTSHRGPRPRVDRSCRRRHRIERSASD
ncbi:hypothetical protein, partial [Micromonospora sp. NPDC005367]|uniref:hypothetical protein n=1 Tax=Micromonospora sp. NPDC005367 TaxID=3155590 RepID=UPI0033AC6D1F